MEPVTKETPPEESNFLNRFWENKLAPRRGLVKGVLLSAASLYATNYFWDRNVQSDLQEASQEAGHRSLVVEALERRSNSREMIDRCREQASACVNRYPFPTSCYGHSFEGNRDEEGRLVYRQIDDSDANRLCVTALDEKKVGCLEDQMDCLEGEVNQLASNQ